MEIERIKSDQRRRYETEVEGIRRRFGDLEEIRERLGFNQRKMAELLLVDPSAWTRWVKGGQAPAHVYRALAWYLELQESERARMSAVTASPASALSTEIDKKRLQEAPSQEKLRTEFQNEISRLKEHYENEIDHLRRLNARIQSDSIKTEKVTLGWKLFLIVNTAAVLYLILSSLF